MPKFRFTQTDKENVVAYIAQELSRRASSEHRRKAENNWRRVDAQIAMEEPKVIRENPAKKDRNAIQPGILSDALEIRTNDALRLAFPQDRKWFTPHVELEPGAAVRLQRTTDGWYRSFIAQQHKDFSLKDRVKLMVSEAYKHGSFVGEVRWDTMMTFPDGRRVKRLSAPVIQPFSMWDAFPDPAPEIVGTDLFYRGSMIIKSKVRREVAEKHPLWNYKGDARAKQPMLDLIYFYGNVVVPRSRADEIIPNRRVVIIEDELVHSSVNDLAHPSIVYGGYEKTDIRSPYYTSPIIKRGPAVAAMTISLNNALDATDLKNYPPTVEDSNDLEELDLSPSARNKRIGGAAGLQVLDYTNPEAAVLAYQITKEDVERGVGDERRAGVAPSTELTATGEMRLEQRAEVRDAEFVGVLERQCLLPFLYMQHELNRQKLESYPFFSDNLNTDDFMRMSKENQPRTAIFDVTGSRTVLGEITRAQKFRETAAAVLSNEFTLARTEVSEVLQQMWQDSGVKDPERFIKGGDDADDGTAQAVEAAVQQVREQAAAAIENLQNQLAQAQANTEVQMKRLEVEHELKTRRQQADIGFETAEQQRKEAELRADMKRKDDEAEARMEREDDLAVEKLNIMRARAEEERLRAQMSQEQDRAREAQARAQAPAPAAPEPPREARVININSSQGGKQVTLDSDAGGRITGATVKPTDESIKGDS